MLKKYKQFINESMSYDKLRQFRDDFVDNVITIGQEDGASFSTLCKSNHDPEEDYINFQNQMDENGFTFNVISDIFSKEADIILGRDIFREIHESPLEDTNGLVDTYLYLTIKKMGLDSKKFALGGPGWDEQIYFDYPDVNEAIIRYSYGYHTTKYGQLMLEQLGMSLDEFKDLALNGFSIRFLEDWHTIISNLPDNYNNSLIIKESEYLIVEEDRIIICTKSLANNIKSSKEIVDSVFIDYLLQYDFVEYIITNDEIVIYCISHKEYLLN